MVADTFPPLRTSGAVQLRDLSREFVRAGTELTVMLPTPDLATPWAIDDFDGVRVLRLRAPKTKDIGYVRRTLAELAMPFAMRRNLGKSPLADVRWDGVIWYSPSIFFGPLIIHLKRRSGCLAYLIIRDIFPEWAADMGLMGRGLPFRFFKAVARYQYSVADVIGVQSPGNLHYFAEWSQRGKRVEVLQNWLAEVPPSPCTIKVASTSLHGRRVFVYAGNMGVAQGMDVLLELCERLRHRSDIGFLFVGRGSEVKRISDEIDRRQLDNVVMHDEIHPDEIPGLYAQCHVGLVALDARHKSHNIPGKFLTYMQSGLPVLANLNRGNDLAALIKSESVGYAIEDHSPESLQRGAESLVDELDAGSQFSGKCHLLYKRLFSPKTTVDQIRAALIR